MDEHVSHIRLSRSDNEDPSRGQTAMVVTAVLTGISAVIVAMRIYTRIGLIKLSGREDWTILVSLVFAIAYLGLVVAQYRHGLGRHSYDIPEHDFKQQLKYLWVAIPIYNASLAFTKISILFQYLRIFPSYRFCIICYIVLGVVILYATWAIVSGFVNCVPVAKFWDRKISGTCLSFEAVWFFNASMNIATDLTLLILPMPLLSQLHLPRRQKVALLGVFALGGLVVITSILRLFSLRTVAKSIDTSWSNVTAAYWTAAECNVAIICACLPFLRPLVSRICPKFLSTDSYNKNQSTRNATRTTAPRSARRRTPGPDLYSQDLEIGLRTTVKDGNVDDSEIHVTTEMVQEVRTASVCGNTYAAETSQTRLV
ncbi:hypothetical protein ASPSYDRAFT_76022 [Aspergillus sydowii CBS 593.65]|uniref:Rhodopsin domain-containing protein n=1 Tax=Aspergillus sydowii CBS 593.65 TaxID=1036612 RepID=A0A1L9TRL1_9EURO|nr:uncharacterized protein ASPSYDRAFT_76022 [Aspergillus sydowii CBS 593.65]OJJ62062.1 hypothetical protein ASPSYDRAFT_76022 [Aspergillus sydowii CBS 593.65]